MQPRIIRGRWCCDGIAVPYSDFFSILLFRIFIKRIAMLQAVNKPMPDAKNRLEDIRLKLCNYPFPAYIENSYKPKHGDEDISAYQFLLKSERHA